MKHVITWQDRAHTREVGPANLDAETLAQELRSTIRGEVRFDEGSRALYATDSSNYRQVPIGVVLPKDVEDVIATVAACRGSGVPLLPRGGGTSLAGKCWNVAVVLDLSKYMHSVLEIDPDKKLARVQPGTILDHLRNAAEHYHLTFGPDPATHSQCTLGGMIGNNSCGVHSVMAGMTSDNIEELEILAYDGLRMRVGKTRDEELERIISEGGRRGEIYARLKALRDKYADLIRTRYPNIPRRVSGYSLDQLLPENGFHVARALVGTEGTCVTVLEATTRLVYSPPARSLLVLGYPDAYMAAGRVGSETKQDADDRARALMEELKRTAQPPSMKLFANPHEAHRIWLVREAALGATVFVPGEPLGWEGWEDAAVPPAKLGGYLRDLFKLLGRYGYTSALYGHFGQGCVH